MNLYHPQKMRKISGKLQFFIDNTVFVIPITGNEVLQILNFPQFVYQIGYAKEF